MNPTVLIPRVRNLLPALVAQQIVGVQPMVGSNSMAFDMAWGHSYPKLGNYNFSRSHWYVGSTPITNGLGADIIEVRAWCEENFGPHPRQPDAWSRWWHYSHQKFYFRDEKDFLFFALRWS